MLDEKWIQNIIDEVRAEGRERRIIAYDGVGARIGFDNRELLNLSSNDYCGLSADKRVKDRARECLDRFGSGATSSRLVCGSLPIHQELEARLAAFKDYESALLFGSGALANVGVFPALLGRNDSVFADKLVHATIIDGIVVSRAMFKRYHHNDMSHLELELKNRSLKRKAHERFLIVTESVFGMDGDLAPLEELVWLAERYSAMLVVDEAHALGVFGRAGRGLVNARGLQPRVDLVIGTLSKALAGYGGFVCSKDIVRQLLVNLSRTAIFSTALPPAVVGAAIGALEALEQEPSIGQRVLENAGSFRSVLKASGLEVGNSASQIVPVIIGASGRALQVSRELVKRGILGVAIRPPTVPQGQARIRFSVTAAHRPADLEWAAREIIDVVKQCSAKS